MVLFQTAVASWAFGAAVKASLAEAGNDAGTFENPGARSRPRFRYWLPDSGVDGDVVKIDIDSAASIGAGGIEFLPFFDYGGQNPAPEGSDWSKYNFGTPAYRKLLVDALTAHKENGMFMDIAIGPNQGQGVPAYPDDEGLQWDLIPYETKVPCNGTFDSTLPGWNDGELVAVISARALSSKLLYRTSQSWGGVTNTTWTQYVLDHTSLSDITSDVSKETGHLSTNFDSSKGWYIIFAFYQRLSGNKNIFFQKHPAESIFDHGSFAVDHHSAQGAKKITQFWEDNILDDEVVGLIRDVGNMMWEDSVEIISNITWTPALLSRFEDRFGYSLTPYLPLLAFENNNIAMQKSDPGHFECILDTPHQGANYINDFRAVLVEGYREYLQALREWSSSRLGIGLSVQPSYGLPQEMSATIDVPDTPECESLSFKDSIDGYRQFSGPAQLASKKIISNEMGAETLKAYQYNLKSLLSSVNRAFAGGVNQFILHGQSYTGNYHGTTWPGYTAFSYMFSELFSEKLPVWKHGLTDVLGYISRLQFALRQGTPKVDVAILNKQSATNMEFNDVYPESDLQTQGWTYSYLSDVNLASKQAIVKDATLAPEGPAWKAFVIGSAQNVTVETVNRVSDLAKAGLPVIVAGTPGYYPTQECSEKDVSKKLSELVQQQNVYQVNPGQVAQKLSELGLAPRIQIKWDSTNSSQSTWYTVLREDTSSKTDYLYIYNDGEASKGHITFSSDNKPYRLDPWTGEKDEIRDYTHSNGIISLPLSLEATQAALIALEAGKHECHIQVSEFMDTRAEGSRKVAVRTNGSKAYPIIMSSGKNVTIPHRSNATLGGQELNDWELLLEHYEKPEDMFDVRGITKYNKTVEIESLKSWTEIPGLKNVSGVGRYSAKFTWPLKGSEDADGAYISFPDVQHALQVELNGQRIPCLDPRHPIRDITEYLKEGRNELVAIVPSNLWNYLVSIWDEILHSGNPPRLTSLMPQYPLNPVSTGLIGVVKVVPFFEHVLEC